MTVTDTNILGLESPIGPISLAVRAGRLCALELGVTREELATRFEGATLADHDPVLDRVRDYFAGDLGALAAIEVDASGTVFQKTVWDQLRRIAPGTTVSYTDIANALGRPTATRAVAMANARNPIAIVVPCHRVIHKDGSLSGYASGVERKQWLLDHERACSGAQLAAAT
jgi:methylated-DNA-[protein]-cysteine S-methyltransferase